MFIRLTICNNGLNILFMNNPKLVTKESLIEMYRTMTVKEMSGALEVSAPIVYKLLKASGIPLRGNAKKVQVVE
jgi:hypothetical protein